LDTTFLYESLPAKRFQSAKIRNNNWPDNTDIPSSYTPQARPHPPNFVKKSHPHSAAQTVAVSNL
jgi:hypothetical protein